MTARLRLALRILDLTGGTLYVPEDPKAPVRSTPAQPSPYSDEERDPFGLYDLPPLLPPAPGPYSGDT